MIRNILLLIVLLIIALVATRQLGQTAAPPAANTTENQPPKVPTRPQDLQQFSDDMDSFVQDSAAERNRKIDQQMQ